MFSLIDQFFNSLWRKKERKLSFYTFPWDCCVKAYSWKVFLIHNFFSSFRLVLHRSKFLTEKNVSNTLPQNYPVATWVATGNVANMLNQKRSYRKIQLISLDIISYNQSSNVIGNPLSSFFCWKYSSIILPP